MIKRRVALSMSLMGLLSLGGLSACSQGSGVLKRDQRALSGSFEHVNSSCEGATLLLEQREGDPSLEISADDDVVPSVRVLVTNDTLYISCPDAKSSQNPVVISLGASTILSVTTRQAERVALTKLIARELRVSLEGKTALMMGGSAQQLRLEVSSASQVRAEELQVQEATLQVKPADWVDAQMGDPGFVAIGATELIDVTMSQGLFLVVKEPKTWRKKLGPEAKVMPFSLAAIPTNEPAPVEVLPEEDPGERKEPTKTDEQDAIDKAMGY